jgi:hypothetical protein
MRHLYSFITATSKRLCSAMDSFFRFASLRGQFSISSQARGINSLVQCITRVALVSAVWYVVWYPLPSFAQSIQYTSKAADRINRSELTVDPSTLGMNIAIPLGNYPGRGTASLPITFYYSSKVWRIKFLQPGGAFDNYNTWSEPQWSENTAAGWTNSLGVPKLVGDDLSTYNNNGYPSACFGGGCWFVREVQIQMPDGSTHLLRHSSPTANWGSSSSGVYYAVDSSQLRYDWNSKKLFLPDGSIYTLGDYQTSTTYADRNGNTLVYNPNTKQWADTLGRFISTPPTPQNGAGDYPYTVPGVGGITPLTYIFRWRQFADARTDPSPPLSYSGDCADPNFTTGTLEPSLFHSFLTSDAVCGPAGPFNPLVLYLLITITPSLTKSFIPRVVTNASDTIRLKRWTG